MWKPVVADSFTIKARAERRTLVRTALHNELRRVVVGSRGAVSPLAAAHADKILTLTTDESTPRGAILEDDGGVSMFWRRGAMSVQVDVTDTGRFYARIRNRDSGEDAESFEGAFPFAAVRSALRQLADA